MLDMTDNELLLAISNMLDPLRQDVKEIRESVKKVELTQENVVLSRLQNTEACYISTFDRYKTSVEDHEQMKDDISLIKQVVMEHSEKLQKIS